VASWDAVRLKREPYRRHYESSHFAMSTAGMVLFFVTALAIVLMIWQQFPSWLDPGWIYPIAVAGVPLTIISMGMTWQGLGLRKAGSFVLAAITPILALFLPLGHISLSDSTGPSLYVVPLQIGAVATEFVGSLPRRRHVDAEDGTREDASDAERPGGFARGTRERGQADIDRAHIPTPFVRDEGQVGRGARGPPPRTREVVRLEAHVAAEEGKGPR